MSRFPPGHFHSPVIDPDEVRRREHQIWPSKLEDPPGIDFRPEDQRHLLADVARHAADYNYPSQPPAPAAPAFYDPNPMFSGLDSRVWFALLRQLRPARVLEVGGGYSTLLAADVISSELGGTTRLVTVEPYPPPFVTPRLDGLDRLIVSCAQDVPRSLFVELGPGDVLFIDSSHVSKPGSDVNFLFLDVLPRLRPGVMVHIHDVFLPRDYPEEWVLGEQRSWNEQYLVQALLTHSTGFEVIFSSAYANLRFPRLIERCFGVPFGGSSLWIRRTATDS
jgi:hypothetical protein